MMHTLLNPFTAVYEINDELMPVCEVCVCDCSYLHGFACSVRVIVGGLRANLGRSKVPLPMFGVMLGRSEARCPLWNSVEHPLALLT